MLRKSPVLLLWWKSGRSLWTTGVKPTQPACIHAGSEETLELSGGLRGRAQGLAGTSLEHRQLSKSPMSQEQEPTGEWGAMGPRRRRLGQLTHLVPRQGPVGLHCPSAVPAQKCLETEVLRTVLRAGRHARPMLASAVTYCSCCTG